MYYYILAPIAVILIGIAKAGFGGGVGIAAVPLFIIATGDPMTALGIMLPLLCACDLFALFHYRNIFDKKNIIRLLPGILIGIAICGYFLGRLGDEARINQFLKSFIGFISIFFVLYQLGKTWILRKLEAFRPTRWQDWLFGIGIGVTSTLAHAAGPVATMYLFPQHLGRRLYVGTTVILFTIVNGVKLIPYFYHDMINTSSMTSSLILIPFVPVGTYLGVWMNKTLNEEAFNAIIYIILFLVGMKFTIGFEPISYTIEQLFGS